MTSLPRHPTTSLIALLVVATLAAVASACDVRDQDIDDATRARVVAAGDSVATQLAGTLSGMLFGAIAEGGPEHAIAICVQEAHALADSVAQARGEGWEVKRTTRRTRNPANAPDRLEQSALDRFHAAEADGGLAHYVQRTPEGSYRYYRPLRTAPMCLECHGDRDQLDPRVRRVLDERYPHDQATGYGDGELRGLIRVTVPAS